MAQRVEKKLRRHYRKQARALVGRDLELFVHQAARRLRRYQVATWTMAALLAAALVALSTVLWRFYG